MSSSFPRLLLVLLLVAAVGVGFWYYQTMPVVSTGTIAIPASDAGIEPETEMPVEKYPIPPVYIEPEKDLVELPDLGDSDAYFKLELKDVFGAGFERILRESGGIERFVTTIDNLPRAKFAERLRPVDGPDGSFQTTPLGDETYAISPDNYARYAEHIELLESAGNDDLVNAYLRFYPLLQESYVNLGYPNAFLNDRLVDVIDHLLATPDVQAPPRLIRPHVLYEFEDAELEALSFGQKTLLRMGPTNAAIVKQRLRAIRSKIVSLQ